MKSRHDNLYGLGGNDSHLIFLSQEEKNTFQVVLATNGTVSFAIFIYFELEWYQSVYTLGDKFGESGTSGNDLLPIRYILQTMKFDNVIFHSNVI